MIFSTLSSLILNVAIYYYFSSCTHFLSNWIFLYFKSYRRNATANKQSATFSLITYIYVVCYSYWGFRDHIHPFFRLLTLMFCFCFCFSFSCLSFVFHLDLFLSCGTVSFNRKNENKTCLKTVFHFLFFIFFLLCNFQCWYFSLIFGTRLTVLFCHAKM